MNLVHRTRRCECVCVWNSLRSLPFFCVFFASVVCAVLLILFHRRFVVQRKSSVPIHLGIGTSLNYKCRVVVCWTQVLHDYASATMCECARHFHTLLRTQVNNNYYYIRRKVEFKRELFNDRFIFATFSLASCFICMRIRVSECDGSQWKRDPDNRKRLNGNTNRMR